MYVLNVRNIGIFKIAKSSEYRYYNSEFEEEKTQENRYFDLTTFL